MNKDVEKALNRIYFFVERSALVLGEEHPVYLASLATIRAELERKEAHIKTILQDNAALKVEVTEKTALYSRYFKAVNELNDDITALKAEVERYKADAEHWHAHFDAAIENYGLTIDRAEKAEASLEAERKARGECLIGFAKLEAELDAARPFLALAMVAEITRDVWGEMYVKLALAYRANIGKEKP